MPLQAKKALKVPVYFCTAVSGFFALALIVPLTIGTRGAIKSAMLETTHQTCAALTVSAMAERLGVTERMIRKAKNEKRFPASWFPAVREMSKAHGGVSEDIFAWRETPVETDPATENAAA